MTHGLLDVENSEEATIAVKKPLRDTFSWLGAMVESLRDGALVDMRSVYAKPKVRKRWVDSAIRKFHSLHRLKERVGEWHKIARARIFRHWAQYGLTKFDGTTIYPSFEARFHYLKALQELPPAIRKQVLRQVEVFDLGMFLQLADQGVIDREVVWKHLGGELEVEVRCEKRQ